VATVPGKARGPLATALAAIASSLGELAAARGSLFALELRHEARRAAEVAALGAAAGAFLHLALLLVAAFVLIAAWDSHRMLAAGAMALLYGFFAVALFLRLRVRATGMVDAFAATREEFRQDFANARGYS
jgi:uncharacterized membrane protein YqjE